MWMPGKEYYQELEDETIKDFKMVDYYAEQAERMKRLYNLTKGRKGLWHYLNKWAYKKNQKYYNIGYGLALKRMGILGYEFGKLDEYCKSIKKLEDKA